jgi:CCR4-NOT complex subunit CAF16
MYVIEFCVTHSYSQCISLSDATHIFDGLNDFPTHVAHMRFGAFVTEPTSWPLPESTLSGDGSVARVNGSSTLYSVALHWLRDDREYRKKLEESGMKTRGAKRDQVRCRSLISVCFTTLTGRQAVPSDSETFYRK